MTGEMESKVPTNWNPEALSALVTDIAIKVDRQMAALDSLVDRMRAQEEELSRLQGKIERQLEAMKQIMVDWVISTPEK